MAHRDTTPAQVFPQMVPANSELTAYEGFIQLPHTHALQQHLYMRITSIPEQPGASLSSCKLDLCEPLALMLEGCEGLVRARLRQSTSLAAFFVELKTLLDNVMRTRPALAVPPPAFYSGLVDEIEEIGWARVLRLQDDLTAMRISVTDRTGREHELQVALPAAYPATSPVVKADLPREVDLAWPPGSSLVTLVRTYSEAVDACCELWECLDDLDRECWVIEPEQPSRSALFRRIAVGNHCSMVVTLDPDAPRSLPECQFMGPDAVVAPLRTKLTSQRHMWDEDRLTRVNLERMLDLRLPSQADAGVDDISANCCICYGYRLLAHPDQDPAQGETPDINCDNPQCGRPFHRSCLAEWLQSSSETRRSFDTLFGQCLYCTQPMTVKVLAQAL